MICIAVGVLDLEDLSIVSQSSQEKIDQNTTFIVNTTLLKQLQDKDGSLDSFHDRPLNGPFQGGRCPPWQRCPQTAD